MRRKDALNAFTLNDATDGERLAQSATLRAMQTPEKIWMRSFRLL